MGRGGQVAEELWEEGAGEKRGGRGTRRLAEGGMDRGGAGRIGGLDKGMGWAVRGVVGLGHWAEEVRWRRSCE